MGVARGQATPTGTSAVSSPQWTVLQYPTSYMALNWPVKVSSRDAYKYVSSYL